MYWADDGQPMGSQWAANGQPMGSQWAADGYRWAVRWASISFLPTKSTVTDAVGKGRWAPV
jgi:hypothetical protein